MRITKENRCRGSFLLARDPRNMSQLGSKFYGRVSGHCQVCGRDVNVRRDNLTAVAHLPKVAE
ncbi:hypothetical protein [Amycolatopsis sp. CFH S0078]|uniref:hypothetical protein n=1 Tax=Amycolatopsis sp. CFH S0078 TaxID=1644108 RepID=UPI00106ECB43|nr:hypothetical protein [Amycolatopsis sp. CFH S0078]